MEVVRLHTAHWHGILASMARYEVYCMPCWHRLDTISNTASDRYILQYITDTSCSYSRGDARHADRQLSRVRARGTGHRTTPYNSTIGTDGPIQCREAGAHTFTPLIRVHPAASHLCTRTSGLRADPRRRPGVSSQIGVSSQQLVTTIVDETTSTARVRV